MTILYDEDTIFKWTEHSRKIRLTLFKKFYTKDKKQIIWILFRKATWQKLRKRWLWHRYIKRAVGPYFRNRIKSMHKYLIATYKTTLKEKCLKLLDIPRHIDQVALTLKLAPTVEQVRLLCDTGRISVNGNLVKTNYIMKQFDLIHSNFIHWRLADRIRPIKSRLRTNTRTTIVRNEFIRHDRKKIFIKFRREFKHYGKKKKVI